MEDREIDAIAEFADSSIRATVTPAMPHAGSLPNLKTRHGFNAALYRRYGNTGNAAYTAIGSFLAIAISGGAAWYFEEPLLFPSLGATAFLFFETPMAEVASSRNAVYGHLVAGAVGFFWLAVFGLLNEPSALQTGFTWERWLAVALSLGFTGGILRLMRAAHPPAGATTIIVALGLLDTGYQMLILADGVVIVVVAALVLNRLMGVPVPIWNSPYASLRERLHKVTAPKARARPAAAIAGLGPAGGARAAAPPPAAPPPAVAPPTVTQRPVAPPTVTPRTDPRPAATVVPGAATPPQAPPTESTKTAGTASEGLVGTEIAGYHLTDEIGRGGMGIVYKADHTATGRTCALKVLTPALRSGAGFRERFQREARYASSLDHPNVIPLYDAGEEDGVLYMAMQYVDGTDLTGLLGREQQLEPERVVNILSQVAAALDAAHAKGLLHRDVKPGNVMIAADDHCFLTDFGLSKNPSDDSIALTVAGQFVGSVDYTAPEQILAKKFDHRVDVYSLGCVLYECLAGQPPFPLERQSDVLYAHIQDPPPKLSDQRPDAPHGLDAVIEKALAKKPEDRYDSCGEMMAAARAAIGVRDADAAVGAPRGEPFLTVTEGKAVGSERIRIQGEFLIGRNATGSGTLAGDPEISRKHARIVPDGAGLLVIEDLGSTNGTLVNGARIGAPVTLSPGDRIEVGGTVLVVDVGPASSSAGPT